MIGIFVALAWTSLALGALGCLVPLVPGPLIAYLSVVVLYFAGGQAAPSGITLAFAGVLMAVVTTLDFVVPTLGAKKFNCSRIGVAGCVVGTLVGLFFMPLGVLAGPFLGAFIGELLAGKRFAASLVGAFGALLGYAAGIALKLAYCVYLAVICWNSWPY